MMRPINRRRSQKGFTLIELLIVIAIIGIIAAMLIPNLIEALQKAKQKATMADERNVGTAWYSWYTDVAGAAAAGAEFENYDFGVLPDKPHADMVRDLVNGGDDPANPLPQYIQTVPRTDAWGTTYEFKQSANLLADQVMAIRSLGKPEPDGNAVADGAVYQIKGFLSTNFESDIVWADGRFISYPLGKNAFDKQEAGGGGAPPA